MTQQAPSRTTIKHRVFRSPIRRRLQRSLPARLAIPVLFRYHLGYFPNLRHPRTLNEKVQYRKLHERNPEFGPLIDKITAKTIVATLLGPEWVTPTLWHGTNAADIPFDSLTPPYVVKASHASGWNLFVLDEESLDRDSVRRQVDHWLQTDFGQHMHEWAYSQVPPGVLVEPFIGDGSAPPADFKLYVFHGHAHYIEVCLDRATEHKCFLYFDRNWTRQYVSPTDHLHPGDAPRPHSLKAMIEAAEMLAAPFGFARVDFFEVEDRPIFGEITFYPGGGNDADHSIEFDRILGDLWQI